MDFPTAFLKTGKALDETGVYYSSRIQMQADSSMRIVYRQAKGAGDIDSLTYRHRQYVLKKESILSALVDPDQSGYSGPKITCLLHLPPLGGPAMIHRRDAMLSLGQLGLGAMMLPGLLSAEKARAAKPTDSHPWAYKRKAKSCIFLFLWGGPPQQDLWDLKPQAAEGIKSLFKPINTAVPGIQIC